MAIDHSRRAFFRARTRADIPIRPPFSGSESLFVEKCTQCSECVAACETQIIKIGAGGYPEIDFSKDHCTFCEKCLDVCEPGALNKSLNKTPGNDFNTTLSIDDSCLAKNKVYCLSCKEVCETQAITFDVFASSIPTPKVNQDACTGCGACISVCPQGSIKTNVVAS